MENKVTRNFIIWIFVVLYLLVSTISTIHVIDFFRLSNPNWLAVTLAIAFEVGAAASLASIIALKKMNKVMIWGLFILLTLMQAMGNTYYAYTHLNNYQNWVELFNLVDDDMITQKRILSLVSGAILPVIALGFIKSLVDYLKPSEELTTIDLIPQPATEKAELSHELWAMDAHPEPGFTSLDDDYETEIIKAGEDAQHKKIMEIVAKKHKARVDSGETYDDEPTALANSGLKEDDVILQNLEDEVTNYIPLPGLDSYAEPDPRQEEKNKILDKIKVFK